MLLTYFLQFLIFLLNLVAFIFILLMPGAFIVGGFYLIFKNRKQKKEKKTNGK